jgi:hypothetical protein
MTILLSIDTTPNPNSMKLNLGVSLSQTGTFTLDNQADAPDIVCQFLRIEGVQSVFASVRFLTVNRDPRFGWEPILQAVQAVLVDNAQKTIPPENQVSALMAYGQIQVLVQIFRDIPIQVKVTDGKGEKRIGLSARFGGLTRELQTQFGDWGVRYGSLDDVAQEVAEEIESLLDEETLTQRKLLAIQGSAPPANKGNEQAFQLNQPDWSERLRAVQQLEVWKRPFRFWPRPCKIHNPRYGAGRRLSWRG